MLNILIALLIAFRIITYISMWKKCIPKAFFDFVNTMKNVSVLILTGFIFDCIKK